MKNKKALFIWIIFIQFSLSFYGCAKKQVQLENTDVHESYTNYTLRKTSAPQFEYNVIPFYSANQSRVDIYIKVSYNKLVFIQTGGKKISSYNSKIRIIDEVSDSLLVDEEFNKYFENDKQGDYYDFNLKSYKLPLGKFIVSVTIIDNNTQRSFTKNERVVISFEKEKELLCSGLLLIHKIAGDIETKAVINPIISKNISYFEKDTIFTFFEIYSKEKTEANIEMEVGTIAYLADDEEDGWLFNINNRNNKSIREQIKTIKFKRFRYSHDIVPSTNQIILPIPLEKIPRNYIVTVKINGKTLQDTLRQTLLFNILPEGYPKIISIDKKLEVTKILMKQEERELFNDTISFEERIKRYNNFWSNINRYVQEEYFRRAEYANERFATEIDGWKTAMGKTYLICGEPDEVFGDRWTYRNSIVFDFRTIRENSKYSVLPPRVFIANYSGNAYSFWLDCRNRLRFRN